MKRSYLTSIWQVNGLISSLLVSELDSSNVVICGVPRLEWSRFSLGQNSQNWHFRRLFSHLTTAVDIYKMRSHNWYGIWILCYWKKVYALLLVITWALFRMALRNFPLESILCYLLEYPWSSERVLSWIRQLAVSSFTHLLFDLPADDFLGIERADWNTLSVLFLAMRNPEHMAV